MARILTIFKWIFGVILVTAVFGKDDSKTTSNAFVYNGEKAVFAHNISSQIPGENLIGLQPDITCQIIPSEVKSDMTTASVDVKKGPPYTQYVTASRLNVRRGPDKAYGVLQTVKRNDVVTVLKISREWAFIRGENARGWVNARYLTDAPLSIFPDLAPPVMPDSAAAHTPQRPTHEKVTCILSWDVPISANSG